MANRPARRTVPDDDLYRRLEVPPNASFEAIEFAWRALLKRHHPDVAGEGTLEIAKRINVAHDWLRDPELRSRYDASRRGSGGSGGRAVGSTGWHPAGRTSPAARTPSFADPIVRRTRFLERVASLTRDELDRLACAESPPLAFVAAIRRFLLPDRLAAVEAIEVAVRERLDPRAWKHPPSRDAVLGAAHDLILGDFLDEHLDEPFRDRAHERLTRAWDAAVGQPRYGPNSAAVTAYVKRLGTISGSELQALEDRPPRGSISAALPWPPGIDPAEDEGLRVSSALAIRDALLAVRASWPDPSRKVQRSIRQAAHALVLRHAFEPAVFDALTAPWRAATEEDLSEPKAARPR